MKNHLYVLASVIALSLVSCLKNKGNNPQAIDGTWSLVSDSTDSHNVGSSNVSSGSKYIGTANDHFIFTTNMLYINEGSIKDTDDYTIAKDTLKLTYNYSGTILQVGNDIIAMPDANNMELSHTYLTPGGVFDEYIILKR
jgi:hypothetical protein